MENAIKLGGIVFSIYHLGLICPPGSCDRKELLDMTPQYKQTLNVYNAYVHYIAENF